MNFRFLTAALFFAATFAFAEPQTLVGTASGTTVAVVSGAKGDVKLWDAEKQTKGLSFPGPFVAAVILNGTQAKVEWDGAKAVVSAGGKDAVATAREALKGVKGERVVLVKADGSVELLKTPKGEETYDAVTAATAE